VFLIMAIEIAASFSMQWLRDIYGLVDLAIALDESGSSFVSRDGYSMTANEVRFPARPSILHGLPFRDTFILCAHLTAFTSRSRNRPSIAIQPPYPTALVAKPAADLSLLSGDRFDLGAGTC